ncbi:MAG: FMN-binding protein [Gammaproteobacteria bacterium]|nr:FMN-binding protein [Gammaproteobacteria bacterium]
MPVLRSSLSLAVIAGACAGLLALTQALTGDRIEANIRERSARLITELAGSVPPASTSWTDDVWNLCNQSVLARAKVAGYGGSISLLMAVTVDPQQHSLRGLRIVSHSETPGLADFLQQPDQGWLGELSGRNRAELDSTDTISGATITSKAVLTGVLKAFAHIRDHAAVSGECGP